MSFKYAIIMVLLEGEKNLTGKPIVLYSGNQSRSQQDKKLHWAQEGDSVSLCIQHDYQTQFPADMPKI